MSKSIEHIPADTLEEARRIIRDAREALGHNLGGGSLLDLLADNMPLSLDEIRNVLRVLGEYRG